MPVNYSGLSGGSSGGVSYAGLSYGSSADRKPKAKRRDHWWEKAGAAAAGVLVGTATSAGHLLFDPVAEIATGGSYESKIDDIGKAIVDDYKDRYSSWDSFKSDPLAGVLDVLTIGAAFFTLGGSLAVRGASLGASATKAARFGGLEASADLTTLGRMVGTKDPRFLRALAKEEADASATLGRKGPIDKLLTGKDASGFNGRVRVAADGTVFAPRRGKLVGIDGTLLETIPLASSPLRRGMTQAGLAVSNSKRFTDTAVIGSAARASKAQNRVDRIKGETAAAAVFGAGGARALRKATKDFDAADNAAAFAQNTTGAGLQGARSLGEMYGRHAEELEHVLTKPAHLQRRIKDEAAFGLTLVEKAKRDPAKARKIAAEEGAKALSESKELSDPAAASRKLEEAVTWNRLAERASAGDLDTYVQQRHNLAEAMRNPGPVLEDLRRRRDLMLGDEIERVFKDPKRYRLVERVIDAQRRASHYTTEFIRGDLNKNVREEMADGTLIARMALGRDPTPEEMANLVVRPHGRPVTRTKNVREVRRKAEKRPTAPRDRPATAPEFSKYSRGYNFAYAQDSMSPGAVFKAFNEARAYKAKTMLLKRMANAGVLITSPEQRREFAQTGAYEFVGGDRKMLDRIASIQDRLDNEVRLIVGDKHVLDEASGFLTDLLAKYTDDAAEWAVPKGYHKHLTAELRRADNFLTRLVDAPTAVFRAAVLNLRPAWMVNNFVGQMMLLLYSQGVYHGLREYMSEVARSAKAGHLGVGARTIKHGSDDGVAGALRDRAGALSGQGGMGRELAEAGQAAEHAVGVGRLVEHPFARFADSAAEGDKGALVAHTLMIPGRTLGYSLKTLSDFMGRLNTVLTDDIPRRAAFMAEVRPLLKRVDPKGEMPADEALRIVLADDEVAARLVDKTMGDLIDFSRLNQAEREVVRRLLPFYGWMKGIFLRTGRLVRDDPHRAAVSYQLGAQYSEGAEERFGTPVPFYLRGAAKIGEDDEGNPRVLPLSGANIAQTPADIVGMGMSIVAGEGSLKAGGANPISQLSPIIKAPLEVFVGKDMFYGGPLYSDPSKGLANLGVDDNPYTPEDESRNPAAAIGARYLSALGPLALYQRYQSAGPLKQDDNRILARTKPDRLAAYLGYPAATLNPDAAAEAAADQSRYGLVKYDPSIGQYPVAVGGPRKPPL